MLTLFETFGFTTLESTLWNLAAYAAFISIIIGVLYAPLRNILITTGAAILALYSALFLKDPVFAALQTLITISGVLQLYSVKRGASVAVMLTLTAIAISLLIFNGALQSFVTVIGVGGLLGIAFGIVLLPQNNAFLLMTSGGVLLVVYAWMVGAWVFFWLNIFFAFANIKEFRATRS